MDLVKTGDIHPVCMYRLQLRELDVRLVLVKGLQGSGGRICDKETDTMNTEHLALRIMVGRPPLRNKGKGYDWKQYYEGQFDSNLLVRGLQIAMTGWNNLAWQLFPSSKQL